MARLLLTMGHVSHVSDLAFTRPSHGFGAYPAYVSVSSTGRETDPHATGRAQFAHLEPTRQR